MHRESATMYEERRGDVTTEMVSECDGLGATSSVRPRVGHRPFVLTIADKWLPHVSGETPPGHECEFTPRSNFKRSQKSGWIATLVVTDPRPS